MAEFAAHGANQEEKMAAEKAKKTIVIGHKNPDTDSICSAIGYANFKTLQTGGEYVPCRAGELNPETTFVLDYFKVDVPKLIKSVKTQVKDIEIRETPGVSKNISLRKAWNLMQEDGLVTLPAVTDKNILEGLITVGDITRSYMNVYDSSILSKACTQYANIIETLEGAIFVGDEKAYFDKGKVLIAAANPDMMEYYIDKNDLVILGNRYESQLCAIEMGDQLLSLHEKADRHTLVNETGCRVGIIRSCDDGTAALLCQFFDRHGNASALTHDDTACTHLDRAQLRLIAVAEDNQSMPISYFMKTEKLITFDTDDFIDDIKDVMASKRFRHFPVLDKEGKYKGLISRRNLLGARGKNVILVDHNERGQAVDGIENANILELIDHHRLGTVETVGPVFFRNQPLGCTATIIFQMYREQGLEIDKTIAGLLCSAIISDTLLFRSPTCTPMDRAAAVSLAEMAGIKLDEFANQMFEAGSELKGKSDAEILYLDFKKFSAGKTNFGVGQINSLNAEELGKLKNRMLPFMEKAREDEGLDMIFFMLTNILTETTELLCVGQGAAQVVADAFHVGDANEELKQTATLPGVVSRKKQLIPALTVTLEQ